MLHRALWLWLLIVTAAILLCIPALGVTQPNIVLVTLESTRADRMGFLGSTRGLTPNLDGLARQSIVFERAYAQAPLTVESHATILTGTYPQTHQVNELASPLNAVLPYLPDLVHARGYRTGAFVGSIQLDPKNGWSPGFDRGFDVYDAGFDPAQPSAERTGDQVVTRAIKWIATSAQNKIFLWVHLNDPQSDSGTAYERAVTTEDAAVGRLIAALRTQKLLDDSIIAIVSDHGESLGAHGEETHRIFLYDETIRVPLLLKLPQKEMFGKRVGGRVRLLDIAPTILEAAGIPIPSQMQGQSLLRVARMSPETDQPAYSRSDFPQQAFGWSTLESWRAGKYLYIRAPKPELYDLSADPGATRNLASTSKAILATMASQLEAFDSRFDKQSAKSDNRGLSSSEVQKLASLGYVGLEKPPLSSQSGLTGTDPKDKIPQANQVLQALTSISQGKIDKALPILRQTALANAYLAQYGLGVALALGQQYPRAIEHLHKAIELQPNSAWAHYAIGASLAKTGDFKTATVHLELASARLPKFRGVHLLLAETYEHLGKAAEAQAERKKAAQ